MAGAGLAALMGILSGTPGLDAGYQEGVKNQQIAAQQAESARHNLALENPTVDINAEVGQQLGVPEGKYNPHLVGPLATLAGKREAEAQAAANRMGLQNTILRQALAMGTTEPAQPAQPELSDEGGIGKFQEAKPATPERRVPNPYLQALGEGAPYIKPENLDTQYGDTLRKIMDQQNPKSKNTAHLQQVLDENGKPVLKNFITDQTGRVVEQQDTGQHTVFTRSALNQAITDYQNNPTPENLARVNTLSMPFTNTPGAVTTPRGNAFLTPATPSKGPQPTVEPNPNGTPMPTVVRGPNGEAYNPPLTNETVVKSAAEGHTASGILRNAAATVRQLAPDAQERISLGARNILQNQPVTRGVQFISDQEQQLATDIGHAQIRYEASMAGLRGAGSPQMYDRFLKIVGPMDRASSPAAWTRLADLMDQHLGDADLYERGSGRRGFADVLKLTPNNFSTRTPQNSAPAPEQPWKDLGNGIRIREKR